MGNKTNKSMKMQIYHDHKRVDQIIKINFLLCFDGNACIKIRNWRGLRTGDSEFN